MLDSNKIDSELPGVADPIPQVLQSKCVEQHVYAYVYVSKCECKCKCNCGVGEGQREVD